MSAPLEPVRQRRRWRGWALRLGGTLAGVAYVVVAVDRRELGAAVRQIPLGALALASALVLVNVLAGAARWRLLLTAYGATEVPRWRRLTGLYLIAFFYNNYLPGAIGGDLIRGVATRDAFAGRGATPAVAVVLIERVLGLAALFILLGVGLVAAGGRLGVDQRMLWPWTIAGIGGSVGAVAAIAGARRVAPWLPRRLGALARSLPELVGARDFAAAIALSIATQALIALAGHVLLVALVPGFSVTASLLVVPLAAATTFIPVTVGGAGAREAVFIALATRLPGVSSGEALAASLALWAAHLIVGAIGGVLQLAGRRAP